MNLNFASEISIFTRPFWKVLRASLSLIVLEFEPVFEPQFFMRPFQRVFVVSVHKFPSTSNLYQNPYFPRTLQTSSYWDLVQLRGVPR